MAVILMFFFVAASAGAVYFFGRTAKADHTQGLVRGEDLPEPDSITPDPRAHVRNDVPRDLSRGMLTFNFDDGFQSAYDIAFPMLEKAGFASTAYVITRSALGHKEYMTWQEVANLAAEGNEIGAHTRHHPQLTTLSPAQAYDEILGSKQDLEFEGYHPNTFAYPKGDYNKVTEDMVKDAGFKGARITQPTLSDPSTDRFALRRQRMQQDTQWEEVKKSIDDAIAQHKWDILVMHRIDEGTNAESIDHELLQQTIDYVKQTGIPVVTTEEGIDVLNAQ